MPTDKYYHFDDEFSFKGVTFNVEVYDEKPYHFGWASDKPPCDRRVAKAEPPSVDNARKEWPKGADLIFSDIVWYEEPVERPLYLIWKGRYKKVERDVDTTVKEQVERLMEMIVEEWNTHANPDRFADVGLNKPNL